MRQVYRLADDIKAKDIEIDRLKTEILMYEEGMLEKIKEEDKLQKQLKDIKYLDKGEAFKIYDKFVDDICKANSSKEQGKIRDKFIIDIFGGRTVKYLDAKEVEEAISTYNHTIGEAWELYEGSDDLMDLEKYNDEYEKAVKELNTQILSLAIPDGVVIAEGLLKIGRDDDGELMIQTWSTSVESMDSRDIIEELEKYNDKDIQLILIKK